MPHVRRIPGLRTITHTYGRIASVCTRVTYTFSERASLLLHGLGVTGHESDGPRTRILSDSTDRTASKSEQRLREVKHAFAALPPTSPSGRTHFIWGNHWLCCGHLVAIVLQLLAQILHQARACSCERCGPSRCSASSSTSEPLRRSDCHQLGGRRLSLRVGRRRCRTLGTQRRKLGFTLVHRVRRV